MTTRQEPVSELLIFAGPIPMGLNAALNYCRGRSLRLWRIGIGIVVYLWLADGDKSDFVVYLKQR